MKETFDQKNQSNENDNWHHILDGWHKIDEMGLIWYLQCMANVGKVGSYGLDHQRKDHEKKCCQKGPVDAARIISDEKNRACRKRKQEGNAEQHLSVVSVVSRISGKGARRQ